MLKEKQKTEITNLIKEYLDTQVKTDKGQVVPIGYNPLEKIRGALFSWIAVPFNGTEVFCQLRCPNATQIEQCGDISNIVTEIKEMKFDYNNVIKMRNYQESLCKITFNNPTFDQLVEIVNKNDLFMAEKRKEFEEIKEHFTKNKDNLSVDEYSILSSKINILEFQLGFILPDDTMAFITRWAMGNDVSDVKRINKNSFLRAASLAKAHNKAPSDYLSGVFTDYNKIEIDAHAFMVLDEYMKEQEIIKNTKGKFRFLGGNKTATNYKAD